MSARPRRHQASRATVFAAAALGAALLTGDGRADLRTQESDERRELAQQAPLAADLVTKGEAAARSGDLASAAKLFGQAATVAPRNALGPRRQCQMLTALQRKPDAIAACRQALDVSGTAVDMLAAVQALMTGPAAPTAEEMAAALRFAERAVAAAPTLPYGYAARCEIAARIGDRPLLERCVSALRQFAPDAPETKRHADALAALEPMALWGLLGATALLGLGALVGAGRRALAGRRAAGMTTTSAAAAAALVTTLGAGALALLGSGGAQAAAAAPAEGQLGQRFPLDPNDPESSVPPPEWANRSPVEFGHFLQDLLDRAERAKKSGDALAVAKHHRALAKAVPDRAVSFRKLCESEANVGEGARAIAACALALTLEGVTVDDHAQFVRVLLAQPTKLSADQLHSADASLAHLEAEKVGGTLVDELRCEIALRQEEIARLEACTAGLARQAPDDLKTITYQFALGMSKRDRGAVARAIGRAQNAGMAPEGLSRMRAAASSLRESPNRAALLIVALALLAAGATSAALLLRRRRAAPSPAAGAV